MAEKTGFNRREFLKIVGAGAGMAASGCARELPEKFIPYVVQPDEIVPGVATWYAASCFECEAGCGTLIRTREGRAVKVEGNPKHPVNRGGLCTLGQSSLQALYDPDRLREPLRREVGGQFAPASWSDALNALADALANLPAGSDAVLLTAPLSASEAALVAEFTKRVPAVRHLEYSFLNSDAVDLAAEQVFGQGARTRFEFSKAKVIVGVGADYLETWLSPCEFARGWAEGRKVTAEHPSVSKVVHFEPRLSLTAANADHWLPNAPGTEVQILLGLLKIIVDRGGKGLNGSLRGQISALIGGVDTTKVEKEAGIPHGTLEAVAKQLLDAPSSLVVAGGASSSGAQAVPAAAIACLINAALGNVGQTVLVHSGGKKARSSHDELVGLLSDIADKKRKVGALIVCDVNPAYTLPSKARYREAMSQIGFVASIATALDETATLANVVLPLSHSLESWRDAEPRPGVYNLSQPAMQPLYKTQSLGDTLVALLNAKAINKPLEDVLSFYDYLRSEWRKRTGEANFESRWLEYVERGGDWSKPTAANDRWEVQAAVASIKAAVDKIPPRKNDDFVLLAFPNARSFDGRAANRPWMQELPDTMTSAVWGSWVEMHPDTAAKHGFKHGGLVQIITDQGSIEAPAYLTPRMHPSVVAVPIGQGHESYGRFANGVGTNVLSCLPPLAANGAAQLSASGVRLSGSISRDTLVTLSGSLTQKGRGIVRSIDVSKLAHESGHDHHGAHGADAGHGAEAGHHDPLALGPREEPKQMYRQMDHPTYRWGMSVDLSSCTGCSACIVACYAENNVPVVGKTICNEGREMSWLHIETYFDGPETRPVEAFLPMMCQHCANAPCEPVCPVYATHHSEDGINSMVYNRCVGTRYCSNNCSYKVRRFNWFGYHWAEPLNWQLNPDVTVRSVGVMEKCTFCVQRVREVQNNAKDEGRPVRDGEIQPACASSCPTQAITFGNLKDPQAQVTIQSRSNRAYKVLDFELNTQPAVNYLARVTNVGLKHA